MPKQLLKILSPRILGERDVYITPWVSLVEREVDLGDGGEPQPFYALRQSDYVSVVGITPSKKVLTVRQYRPAVGECTLELPAGTIDKGETAEQSAVRELVEETGHEALAVTSLGAYYPDTGRSLNLQHAFLIDVPERPKQPPTEHGISVEYYSLASLHQKIRTQEFRHQLHISVLLLAALLHAGKM